ncbi:MAG TPA: M50 family metallopeptidase, partial [Actinomycetota bacterium]|nr:M50 family metallopeptidase [Actinomycetota bacterium]
MNVDSSWIWIAVLVTFSVWSQFRLEFGNIRSGTALALAVFAAVLFFGSVFLHEVAHAVAARLHGIKVFGITLVVFGGFTSARSDEKGPGPAFVISAVGPLTSLALGALFWALSVSTDASGPLSASFGYVGWVNLLMAGFNFLPGLPLDGGRMLEATVWRLSRNRELGTRIASRSGVGLGGLLLAGGLFEAVIWHDPFRGLWLAIIGIFILQSARAAEAQIGLRRRLAQATVAEVMEPPPPPIPAGLSLSEALDRYLRGHEGEAFPVVDDDRVTGMLTFGSARDVGMVDPLRPVRDAVIPLSQVLTVDVSEPL